MQIMESNEDINKVASYSSADGVEVGADAVMEPVATYGAPGIKESILSLVSAIDDVTLLQQVREYLQSILSRHSGDSLAHDLDQFSGDWGGDEPVEEYARDLRSSLAENHRNIETW